MNEKFVIGGESELMCPMCEASHVKTQYEKEQFLYGANNKQVELTAYVPVHHCEECDYEFVGEKAASIRHDAICRHLGLLTPGEIREKRMQLRGSQKAFSDLTRLGEATIQRWENGQILQSFSNDIFLRLLDFPENVERIERYNRRMSMEGHEGTKKTFTGRALSESSIQNLSRSQDQFTLKRKTG